MRQSNRLAIYTRSLRVTVELPPRFAEGKRSTLHNAELLSNVCFILEAFLLLIHKPTVVQTLYAKMRFAYMLLETIYQSEFTRPEVSMEKERCEN